MAYQRTAGAAPYRELGARLRTGVYYGPAGSASTNVSVLNRLCCVPLAVDRALTVDRIGINITTAGAGGSVVRLGIYADVLDGVGGYPGALVLDAGTVAGDAIAFVAATVSQVLTAGIYWLAAVAQVGTPTWGSLASLASQLVGYQGGGTVASRTSWTQDSVSGALPATFTSSPSSQGGSPLVQVRIG